MPYDPDIVVPLANGGIEIKLADGESIAAGPVEEPYVYARVTIITHSGNRASVELDIDDQEALGNYLLTHAATANNRELFEKEG